MIKLPFKIKQDSIIKLSSSIFAIILGLLIGLIILFISNSANAMKGFETILAGGFTGGLKGIGNVFYLATPIIMTGLSVGFAFKTGLFNIGPSGQMIVGAYCGLYVSVTYTGLPPQIHWVLALLAAALGGALWGLIPGILKAYYNVNEVIATIMMNYIGMYLVNYMVKETIYNSLKNQSKDPIAVIPRWGMDKLFPDSSVHGGIIIAIVCAIIIYIILNKTTFGYELKACGFNMDAARYAGINSARGIMTSMTIAGALAGIGGGLLYLAKTGKSIELVDILAAEGFAGIPVALLGLSNPIGIVFSALFISHITQGGFQAQIHGFSPEIIKIMTSVVIYFSAFALFVKNMISRVGENRTKRRLMKISPVLPETAMDAKPADSSRSDEGTGEVKSDE
ncbi:MAG: ABC transporter permease [Saccharofermentanales bacterium]